jgi:dTDP-glucose pyrophosphorylase
MNTIEISNTVKDAIEILEAATDKLLVILDQGKVVGTLSDGDLRRYFFKGGSVSSEVTLAMNSNPLLTTKENLKLVLDENETSGLKYIVVVNKIKEYVELFTLTNESTFTSEINTAVLMAGGEGTRLRPYTNKTPKPMIKVGGIPILERQLSQLKTYGFINIFISINYLASEITNYFGDGSKFGLNIKYLHEDQKLGTAGALSLIKSPIGDNFLLMNGDIITNIDFKEMAQYHNLKGSLITIAAINHHIKVPFGVLNAEDGILREIVEKPIYTNLCNAGIYMINSKVLEKIPKKEYHDITSTIAEILDSKDRISVFPIYESWSDIGTPEDLLRVDNEFKIKIQ